MALKHINGRSLPRGSRTGSKRNISLQILGQKQLSFGVPTTCKSMVLIESYWLKDLT